MSTKNDGGTAFPAHTQYQHGGGIGDEYLPGMSLRDWFAGMALQGLAANQENLLRNKAIVEHFGTAGIDRLQANKAYRLADAMLAEREK